MVSSNWLVPNVSLRVPSFFGPVVLSTALLLASSITPPTYNGFNVVQLSDPTFTAKIGIWGVCEGYKTDNATTANPNATLTGNATFDGILHHQGTHDACSSSMMGWTYSLLTNGTGASSFALPNTTLGVNVDGVNENGNQYVQVMTESQSSILVMHLVSGIPAALAIALLVVPYKRWEKSSPDLARLLKVGSLSLILIVISFVLALVAFAIDLSTSKSIANNINAIGDGSGVRANVGTIQWYALSAAIVFIPALVSTRGQGSRA